MKEYSEGSLNILSKFILKSVSSHETFLDLAMKEKPEKVPSIVKRIYQIDTLHHQGFEIHTINKHSKNHTHIVYFHGGGLCLNGGLPQWMMLHQWIKQTDAKASYVIYPMIPEYKTQEIYETSFEMYKLLLTLHPDDNFVFVGDSAGGLIILSMLQLIKLRKTKAPSLNILLSPWIDFSLSNPKILEYKDSDQLLSLSRFEGLKAYDNIYEFGEIIPPLEYRYHEPIQIYTGTEDMLYPDMLLFEEKNPNIHLDITTHCPHVFMLLPMKSSKRIHQQIIESIRMIEKADTPLLNL
jgi:epsilon-lactone hydrolase